jgi:hypothetical protein
MDSKTLSAFIGAVITTASVTYGVVNAIIIERMKIDMVGYEKKISDLEAKNGQLDSKMRSLEQPSGNIQNDMGGQAQSGNVILRKEQVSGDIHKSQTLTAQVPQKEIEDYQGNVANKIIKRSNYFEFKMTSCYLSGSVLTVEFIVTDLQDNRHLDLVNKIRMIDDSGNEYLVRRMSFGKTESTGSLGKDMIRGVPVKLKMIFDGVSGDIRYIKALQVFAFSGGAFDFTFDNVRISS